MSDELIDTDRLNAYFADHAPQLGALRSVQKFGDGQSNPTFLLTTTTGQVVLRRQPAGELLKSAHAVDREFRVLQALEHSAVPVAAPIHLCTDRDVLGCLFYLMGYAPGRIFWDPTLPELSASERGRIYDEMNRVLVALHEVDVVAVGLEEFGRPGNYFERQVSRWSRQYRASETETLAAMDHLIEWLPANMPPDDAQVSLIHGDYRIDNLVFDASDARVTAVLDWELSTLGHPYADLAYQCMQWRMPRDCVLPGLGDADRAALGIPEEASYVARYCDRRGLDGIPNWAFYLAFSYFRFAAILQGVKKRALEGNASSDKAMAYGDLAPLLARDAVALID